MKKIKLFGIALLAVMYLASCGGDGNQKNENDQEQVKKKDYPKKINLIFEKQLNGGLSDFFEVTNAIVKIKMDDDGYVDDMLINIELQRTDNKLTFDGSNVGHLALSNWGQYPFAIEFSVDLLDGDGVPIETNFDKGSNVDSELSLLTLPLGEKKWIQYDLNYNWALDIDEVIEIKSIKVNSKLTNVNKIDSSNDGYSTYSNDNYSKNESVSNEDWDAVLNSYESYIDQYIKLMKKAVNGDVSAITEYASMMEKATDLSEKMSNAGNNLTSTQMSKFIKLQTKLANSVTDIYN